MKAKSVVTTTVGYMCIGLVAWMTNMPAAGWFSQGSYGLAGALLLPLAAILVVMGILAFLHEGALDAVIFFVASSILLIAHYRTGVSTDPASYLGWYGLVTAVIVCYIWLGSFKAGTPRMLFLLATWLGFLSGAIGDWSSAHFFVLLSGYLGLVSGVLALIVSANAIACDKSGGDATSSASS